VIDETKITIPILILD